MAWRIFCDLLLENEAAADEGPHPDLAENPLPCDSNPREISGDGVIADEQTSPPNLRASVTEDSHE